MPIRRRRPGVVDQSVPTATEPRRSGEASGGDSTSLTAGAMVSMKVPPSSAIVFSSQDALPDREEGAELKRRHYRNSNSSSASTPLIGHTPNGRRFAVPKTHDMVSSLFNPTKPKSHFDWVILFTLSLHAIVYLTFPAVWRWKFLLASFAFWRIAYNGGLGLILKWQSERRGLVNWFIRNGLLKMHYEDTGIADYNDGDDNNGKGPAPAGSASNPAVAKWLRQQLEVKMGPDYDFDAVPAEFNAWLLYRQLVDLVLLNDFFAYFFFCLCFVSSSSDMWWKAGLRQAAGWMLLAFNLWVKIDAHRVVKDYAWYWGDFFFLVDQSLTFDGVFEMAPHPMYSIGYAGYYGGSLITGSYTVFYVSLAAHLCQFLFLSLVENPHIEKTYERPPIALKLWRMKRLRSRSLSEEQSDSSMDNTATKGHDGSPGPTAKVPAEALALSTSFRNDLVIFKNLDLLRAADLMLVLLLLYGAVVPAVVYMVALRHSLTAQIGMLWLAVGQCLFWITFRTLGLGYILRRQSESQWVIRWFLRHGGTADEAFTSWRAIYNAALAMTYASFSLLALVAYFFNDKSREMASAAVITAASNTYADPVGFLGSRLLAPTLGVLLIAFHIWSSKSVYDALGDFGWFYGDFFVQNLPADRQKLAFTGVYRYLNNPEKVIGQAAFYGLALISGSWVVLGLAMTLQVANFLFLTYVESPHMFKLYGSQLQRDSGVVRSIKSAQWAAPIIKGLGIEMAGSDQQPDEDPAPRGPAAGLAASIPEKDGSVVPLDEAKLDRVLKDLDLLAMVTDKTSSVRNLFNDTKNMITQATTKFAERSIPFELAKVPHLSHYQIQLQPSAISGGTCGAEVMPASGSPLSESDTKNLAGTRPSYVLGEPIRVSWCVPATHSQKDWIGVYPVTANPSDQLTIVSSWGRYVYIRPDRQLLMSIAPGDSIYASITKGTTYAPLTPLEEGRDGYDKERLGQADAVQLYYGEAVFSSHSLPWKVGIYEMRLHHATTHSVLRKSMAFEICAPDLWPQIPLPHTAEAVAKELLSLANRCLAETVMETSLSGTATPNSCSDPSASSTTINNLLAPLRVDIIKPLQSVRDRISIDNTLSEQQAKRLTYMVKVSFGVEFEPDVLIQAAKRSMTVLRVAERILKAKQTLETLSSTIIG